MEFNIVAIVVLVALGVKYFFLTAPFVPTKARDLERINQLIREQNISKFCDVGCGNSRVLAKLAKDNPEKEFYGVEIAPLLFFISKIRSMSIPNLTVRYGGAFGHNWKQYDGLFFFWLPKAFEKNAKVFVDKVKAGQKIISYCFPIPALEKSLVKKEHPEGHLPIYVYEIGD